MFCMSRLCNLRVITSKILKSRKLHICPKFTQLSTIYSHNAPTISPLTFVQYRLLSDKINVAPEDMIVDYEQVLKSTNDINTLIIDVREPDEIKEYGKIPNSINIPLGNVTQALGTLPDREFVKLYNRHKPKEDTPIIFYCMIGKRSGMALQNALNLGYKNTKNYLGSWNDWAAKKQ